MDFKDLEEIMKSKGIGSLAEIARTLETTPQAVSNWKSRNQVPHHVVAKISLELQLPSRQGHFNNLFPYVNKDNFLSNFEEKSPTIADLLLVLSNQIKYILFVPFVSVFLMFTYVKFIKIPIFESSAKILLPESKGGSLGGLAGLASQFGVNIPMESTADLSSPSLYPELIRSRTFAEIVFKQEIFSPSKKEKIPLLSLLTSDDKNNSLANKNELIQIAMDRFNQIVQFIDEPTTNFSTIIVRANNPTIARDMTNIILDELEKLNRFFRMQNVDEKIIFIKDRISSVEKELVSSETRLKTFKEKNRQVMSPSLQLENERLTRDVEIQKGIFITLKQQLELAKIEEIQETSIVQVLDKPQIALSPSNINTTKSLSIAFIISLLISLVLAFSKHYYENSPKDEKKKIRDIRIYLIKNIKALIKDTKITGSVSLLLLAGLPFYFTYQSKAPTFFGMYSNKLMIVLVLYSLIMLVSIILFSINIRKNRN